MTAATKRIRWVCIALTLGACGEDLPQVPQGVWDIRPEQRWRLVETLRIGASDGDHPAVFGDIRNILVDQMNRMWVVDQLATEVRVFTPDGGFVRAIGRRGEGPGEFRRIGDAFHGANGEIWVEDVGRRWEVFDTAGKVDGHTSAALSPRKHDTGLDRRGDLCSPAWRQGEVLSDGWRGAPAHE